MITLAQYFRDFEHTPEHQANAEKLLDAVNLLMGDAFADGIDFKINPATLTNIAGTQFGGFRPQDCCEGAPKSSHKQAMAVDVFDGNLSEKQPFGTWCQTHQDKLEEHGLYMENPLSTRGKWTAWVHLTTRAPASGRRVFQP